MENNKSFTWPQGILFAFLALCGSLTMGFIIPINLIGFEAETQQTIKNKNINHAEVKAGTQQRLKQFKSAMLTSWQQQAKEKGFFYTLPTSFQGTIIRKAKVAPNKKVIALTFDDGPWPEYTAQVLNTLRENNIKATFFIVGKYLKNNPELGKRIVAEGHVIGNHSWHHWYHYFNQQAAAFEIDNTSNLIYQITGVKTNLFRPPGGMLHNGLAAYARGKNYAVVMWSADSADYSRPSTSVLINRVLQQSKSGGIVLMHDGGGNRSHTVAALPVIISKLRKQGYSFVTIPELLAMQEKDQKLMTNTKINSNN
ncbi:MAG: polysaccharide deacetylase family protein [Fischerella sp.]|nr:polysaccharide deacetylase family protein [Fischerella sp.]